VSSESVAVALFEALAGDLAALGFARNRRGSLLGADGSVRAMTSRGRIVVKLGHDRARDLFAQELGVPYKGQVNQWVELLPELSPETVDRLVRESLKDS